MISYNVTQWILILIGATIGLGGGILIALRMCKREGLSFWKLLIGMEKGAYITYYTLTEKLVLVLLAVVSLGIVAIAMKYF
jgi:hypothetical protein